jgi:hypothetical protein
MINSKYIVINYSRKAAAQATAYGFLRSKPEPQAHHDGLVRLGYFRLGLGRLPALGRAVHITNGMN